MLGPARYFRLHTESVKFATQGVEHSMNVRLALTAFASGPTAKIRTTLGLDLPAWREGKALEITRRDFTARGVLELALPPLDRPRVLTGRRGHDEFFYAEAPVALARDRVSSTRASSLSPASEEIECPSPVRAASRVRRWMSWSR